MVFSEITERVADLQLLDDAREPRLGLVRTLTHAPTGTFGTLGARPG
ncbi:hypothetical protein [Salana multivorans]